MFMSANGGTFWRSVPGWPIPVWIHTNAPYLSHAGYRVSEMLAPNIPPYEMRAPARTSSVSNGLHGLGQATSAPVFFSDIADRPVTSVICGEIYNLHVPGWDGGSVYLIQTKDGRPQFSGLFPVPMLNYQSNCLNDPGTYVAQVFDPASGNQNLIGTATLTVHPKPGTTTTPTTTTTTTTPTHVTSTSSATSATTPATGGIVTQTPLPTTMTDFFSQLGTTGWLIVGGVVLVLLFGMQSGGRS